MSRNWGEANYSGTLRAAVAANLAYRLCDVINIEHHVNAAKLVVVNVFANLVFYLRLCNVVHGKPQGETGQRSSPCRIAFRYRQGVNLAAIGGWGSQDNHHVVFADALDGALNLFLTFQVNSTGGCSDEAVGHLQDDLRACAASAIGYRTALNAVTLA